MRLTSRHPAPLTAALLCTALAACGGSSSSSSTTSASTTATSPAQSTTTASSSVTTGPVRGALHGTGHAPIAGRPWAYSVHVTDASGKPLYGAVDIEFAFNGSVVGYDTPRSHRITNGRWADKLTFPDTAIGYPLAFQAVVHTSAGSITLDWPVQVKP